MKFSEVNNFDAVSGVYDALARLVFGKSIKLAQQAMLSELSDANTILIIGGGTGWLLEDLLTINQTAEIWYVEASRKMLERARHRLTVHHPGHIRFIHGTENVLPIQPVFDAVIANFYFDMFTITSLPVVMRKIRKSMKQGAVLVATDFVNPKTLWQTILLSTMYAFFRVVSKLQATTLSPWRSLLLESGFKEEFSHKFYNGFIEAKKYVVC